MIGPDDVVGISPGFQEIFAGEVVIKFLGQFNWHGIRAGAPNFGDREDVLVNPGLHDDCQAPARTGPESLLALEGLKAHLRRERWLGSAAMMFGLAGNAIAGVLITLSRYLPLAFALILTTVVLGSSSRRGIAAARELKYLRRSKRCRNAAARPMSMRLYWAAGFGHGPLAVAELHDEGCSIRVPVVGLMRCPDLPGPVDVLVRSRPRGGAALIEWDGQTLRSVGKMRQC